LQRLVPVAAEARRVGDDRQAMGGSDDHALLEAVLLLDDEAAAIADPQ
jgi:hypothetical protein